MTPEAIAYEKHKNLKIDAQEIGIKWQTLYLRLKNQGIAVIGDKLRYGSDRDKLSAKAEAIFKGTIYETAPNSWCRIILS